MTRNRWILLLILLTALAYRLALMTQYYGWEESDYGNLAMAKGVLDSSFTHYDMAHLPLYYGLSGLLMGLTGDAISGTHGVSLLSGLFVIIFTYLILRRIFDEATALLAASLLILQPEVALYSATALREPLYAALWLGALASALGGRNALSAILMGGAFLTRFDALLSGMPLMVLIPLLKQGPIRLRLKKSLMVAILSMAIIGGWSLYCGVVHGDYVFFRSTIQVNVDTGGAQEIRSPMAFLEQGFSTSLAMLTQTLHRKIGPPLFLGAFFGLFLLLSRAKRHRNGAIFAIAAILNTGFWLAVGFFAQHEPDHNLYWKWMYVLVPFWVALGTYSILYLSLRLPKRWGQLVAGVCLIVTLGAFMKETQAQLQMSETLYKPQLDLAKWIESSVPEGTALVLDNIPACYINRKDHNYQFHNWFDLEVEPNNKSVFERYLLKENIQYVLWFQEEWTQAPVIAPFLAAGKTVKLDTLELVPMVVETNYGFAFYSVHEASGEL